MARRVTGKGWDAAEAKSRFREVLDAAGEYVWEDERL